MSRKLEKATSRWLGLEREGTEDAAETALAGVFRALPLRAPSRALIRRTLAELGELGVAQSRATDSPPHWVFRWAVSLALVVSGLATVIYLPVLWRAFSLQSGVNWFVDLGAGLLTTMSRLLATVVTLWDVVSRAGGAAAEMVATPQVLGGMFLTVLFALATLRLLTGIVAVERSRYHA